MTFTRQICCALSFVLLGSGAGLAADLAAPKDDIVFAKLKIDSDAAERLRLANQLPMLTQRVAAASCAMSAGVAVEDNRDVLKASSREFGAIIRALTSGNPHMNIAGPEQNRRLLNDIEIVSEAWGYTKSAIYSRLSGRDDAENAVLIDAHSSAILAMTSTLAADFYGHYVQPFEIKQSDAMALTIASRQALLTQQIAHDACQFWASDSNAVDGKKLQDTIQVYENSLTALRGGMANAGLQPAPTAQIADELTRSAASWAMLKKTHFTDVSSKPLNSDEKQAFLSDLNAELHNIERLVGHYVAFAERHH
ncbi:MAG: hypothetical protein AAF340_11130 [Pseudomonadota bacterium]